MFKNQLQELAQRSCFNLPSYVCTREGPDHAPRFKASVNFNGEIFESPTYCTTLRQAEHAAAEVALNALSSSGPSRSLTARVLDETGVYKNLLQETAHRAGLNLPVYTTVRSGPGHLPVFTSKVELAGMNFAGEPAKTKKQAEKNAAIAAWSALKTMPNFCSLSQTSKSADGREGSHDQITVTRALSGIPQDETRSMRRRYQNQSRRKVARNFQDNGTKNDTEQQERKFMDLFVDFSKEGSTEKHKWFVSLVPPPPPRTTTKILPPSCPSHVSKAKPIPVEVRDKSQDQIKPPGLLNEHYRDDAKWLKGKTETPLEKEGSCKPSSSTSNNASHVRRPISPSISAKHYSSLLDHTANISSNVTVRTASPHISATPVMASRCPQKYAGGHNYPLKIAPAVQIRSVIPVCAAPPPKTLLRPSPLDPSLKNEAIQTLATETGSEATLGGSKQKKFNSTLSKPGVRLVRGVKRDNLVNTCIGNII